MKMLILALFSSIAMAGYPPTTSQVSGDSTKPVTFNYLFPNFTGTHTATTLSLGVNSVAGGGTGSTSFTAGSIPFSNGTILTQNNSQLFWNNSLNYLGIGANFPDSPLTVNAGLTMLPPPQAGTSPAIHIGGANYNGTYILIDAFSNTGQLALRRSDGTSASPSAVQSGDLLANFVFSGYGATSYQTAGAAKIVSTAAENWSDTTGAAILQFFTRPSGTVGGSSERVRIDQNGNVGVGTTTPGASMDITGSLRASSSITDSALTQGSVLFAGASGLVSQSNSNLFWDNTNLRLGIGTNTPNSAVQILESAAGNVSISLQNTSSSSSNSSTINLLNDTSVTGSLSMFGSTFVATYLQSAMRLAGSKALWLSSDVGSASGGTDNIVFSPGGYNNITAQATSAGLTAINYTDTGIATSGAGAPLSINNSQVVVSGIFTTRVTSTTAVAVGTTATSLLSYTPPAGTYIVWDSANITASSAGGNKLSISVYVGGTQIAVTNRSCTPLSSSALATFQAMSLHTNTIVTVNGSQAVAIYGISSAGTVTVTEHEMDLMRSL